MAIKFDFNRLRTAVDSFYKAKDTVGEEVVHLPALKSVTLTFIINNHLVRKY